MRFRHLTWLAAGLAAFLAAGCAGSETADTDDMGTARVSLITPQVLPFDLTRVSVETDTGISADLTRDPNTGVFTGTLLLPAGMHELTGRAFVGAEQVGVSSPVPADIQAGAVTQVMIQILDITGGQQPDFGPILESLSHPTTANAGVEVMFAVSVIDPDGTAVSIDWADDCADSTFTAPQSTATGWSKATPGTCTVTVTGASNGLSISQSFAIVVFEAGANQGAVEIINEFVPAPAPELQLFTASEACFVSQFSSNASCAIAIASPAVASLQLRTDWQNGVPGAVTLSDDCGGSMVVTRDDPFFALASWLPPVQGGLCRITARATSQEGVVGAISMAVLARPGTPPPPAAFSVSATLFGLQGETCSGSSDQGETACGPARLGSFVGVEGTVSWGATPPGSIAFADSCGGSFRDGFTDVPAGRFSVQWQVPFMPVPGCTVTVTGTSIDGASRSAVFRFDVQ